MSCSEAVCRNTAPCRELGPSHNDKVQSASDGSQIVAPTTVVYSEVGKAAKNCTQVELKVVRKITT